jgi:TorA maturation chaperone TorD
MGDDDLRQLMQTRANVYGRLQYLYSYPLSKAKLEPLLQVWTRKGGVESDEDLSLLEHIVSEANNDWDSFVEGLNVEYTRLFIGPGRAPAPPYASFYLEGGQLMGEEVIKVRRMYLGWKMVPLQLGRVPDDHIALEFAFLGHLSTEGYLALVQNDETRFVESLRSSEQFLREHVLTWVPAFCKRIAAATHHQFFRWLADATQHIVESDAVVVRDLLEKMLR